MLSPKINISFTVNAGDNGWWTAESRTRSKEGLLLQPNLEIQALSIEV